MKLTTEQLEKLAKMMPYKREARDDGHRGIWFEGEGESPEIINWALDELAKRGLAPMLSANKNDAFWVVTLLPENSNWQSGATPHQNPCTCHGPLGGVR